MVSAADQEKRNAYMRVWRLTPKGQANDVRRRDRVRSVVRSAIEAERQRRGNVCMDCGTTEAGNKAGKFEFHHRDPLTNRFRIAAAVASISSLATLKIEMDKCDLLCRPCHLQRHHREGWNRGKSKR